MINLIHGNLLDSKDKILIHGMSCQNVSGAGIVLPIKKKYPKAIQKYHDAFKIQMVELGQVIWWHGKECSIANCITQIHVGGPNRLLSYTALEKCLDDVLKIAKLYKQTTISSPLIGGGLAKGEPNVIFQILYNKSKEHDVNINIYIFEKELYDKFKEISMEDLEQGRFNASITG